VAGLSKIEIIFAFSRVKKMHAQSRRNAAEKAGYKPDCEGGFSQCRAVNQKLRIEQDRTHHKSGKQIVFHAFL
jgi:hypothetical protein